MKPIINIPYFPGTNCHRETEYAFKIVGGDPRIILLNRVLTGKERLSDCDLLCFPGGFGFGDHIRAGQIAVIDLLYRLKDQFLDMLNKKIPMIGICNGFQVLAGTGVFDDKLGNPQLVLDMNVSAKFEHRRNTKVVIHHQDDCVWTEGLDGMTLQLPVAHAEGRLVYQSDVGHPWTVLATYGTRAGVSSYPISPNGSHIAGICRGNIMGLMPHPERRVDKGRHGGDEGLLIFENGVKAVK